MSKPTAVLAIGAIIGLALIAGSLLWTSRLGPTPRWTPSQAQQYQQAGAEYHRLAHQHAHATSHGRRSPSAAERDPTQSPDAALAAARTRWQQTAQQLAAARNDHQRTATLLKWSGVFLAGVSLLGLCATRKTQ